MTYGNQPSQPRPHQQNPAQQNPAQQNPVRQNPAQQNPMAQNPSGQQSYRQYPNAQHQPRPQQPTIPGPNQRPTSNPLHGSVPQAPGPQGSIPHPGQQYPHGYPLVNPGSAPRQPNPGIGRRREEPPVPQNAVDVPWVLETRLRPGEQVQSSNTWGIATAAVAGLNLVIALFGLVLAFASGPDAFVGLLPFWGILTLMVVVGIILCFVKRGKFNRWIAIISACSLVLSNPIVPLLMVMIMFG